MAQLYIKLLSLICLETWKVLQCTGSRPPPIGDFTFNKIDKTRALLYGGRVEKTTFSSVYILDCELLVSGLL